MNYSYDRTANAPKTASFQDRAKGSFEVVVWINGFSMLRSRGAPMLSMSGTLSIFVGGDSEDATFNSAIVKKKGAKWVLESGAGDLTDPLLAMVIEKGSKLPAELDRIHAMLSR